MGKIPLNRDAVYLLVSAAILISAATWNFTNICTRIQAAPSTCERCAARVSPAYGYECKFIGFVVSAPAVTDIIATVERILYDPQRILRTGEKVYIDAYGKYDPNSRIDWPLQVGDLIEVYGAGGRHDEPSPDGTFAGVGVGPLPHYLIKLQSPPPEPEPAPRPPEPPPKPSEPPAPPPAPPPPPPKSPPPPPAPPTPPTPTSTQDLCTALNIGAATVTGGGVGAALTAVAQRGAVRSIATRIFLRVQLPQLAGLSPLSILGVTGFGLSLIPAAFGGAASALITGLLSCAGWSTTASIVWGAIFGTATALAVTLLLLALLHLTAVPVSWLVLFSVVNLLISIASGLIFS